MKEIKRKDRETKEIKRLEREQAKPKRHAYLSYLLLICCVVYIADEIASQIGTQMQSVLAQAIFAPVFGADMAVARMSAFGVLSQIGTIVAFLYKPLSDRYGRKPFLVINTLGMGLGLLFTSIATNIPVYLVGAAVIALFIPHDMQVVYIFECTPARHRAKAFSGIKAVATLGMMLVPLLRRLFMGADFKGWRSIYFVLALFAAGAAVFALLFARETDAFVAKRLEYLRASDEEREKTARRGTAKKEQHVEQAQGGFLPAIKFCMRNKQLRWLLIGGGFVMWGLLMTMYYETTMVYGYSSRFLAQGVELGLAQASAAPLVTQALFWFPVGSALFQFVQGFLSDKWGRKPTLLVMASCAVASFGLFFLGGRLDWPPWLVGFLCGAAIGSYWASTDIAGGIMCSESTPTNLRSSVLAVQPILSTLFSAAALGAGLLLINLLGDASAGLVCLGISVPGMLIGLLIISWKVRETKNVNLEAVTGHEG
ncbi:MAG: MFS transporter [Clostridia bacterium]|nr:MFS transporter [Clostridia bacterium]